MRGGGGSLERYRALGKGIKYILLLRNHIPSPLPDDKK